MKLFGIFNVNRIGNTSEFKNLCEKLKTENRLEDVSCNQRKSFILTSDMKNCVKGFISNIGTNTMKKRMII